MPRYRLGRRTSSLGVTVQNVDAEPTYRDLQAEAKERGIPANQSADELKEALAEPEVEKADGD